LSINWVLSPYYELSFVKFNDFNNVLCFTDFIKKLETLKYGIKLSENSIIGKIENYINKMNTKIEFNIWINIYGTKHSKIIFEYLSDEIIQICFCFFEEDINKKGMTKLKELLNDLMLEFNGIVGMVGYETVCNMIFFKTKKDYPNKEYTVKKLEYYTNEDIYKNNEKWLSGVELIIWGNKN